MGAPDAVPARGRSAAPIAPLAVTAAVAVVTFLLAYDGGTFGDTSRQTLAVAVWWVVILAGVAGLWPLAGFNRTTLLAGGFLAAYAGLTLASVIWADSAEDAFSEFNRAALYVGVFALAALAVRRGLIPRWTDGFALGIVAVAGLAFFSRCFPDLIAPENLLGFRLDLTRLSYPLGYWNGLAIFVALAVPFLLRLAVSAAPLAVRALALAPFPVLGAVLYLTSSRGGLGTAVVGTLALYALVPRTRTVEAILIAAAGAAGGIACVVGRDQLVNHPGPDRGGRGARRLSDRSRGLRGDGPRRVPGLPLRRRSARAADGPSRSPLACARRRRGRPPRRRGGRGRPPGSPLRAFQGAAAQRAEHAALEGEPDRGAHSERGLERAMAAMGERDRRIRKRARPRERRGIV